MKKRFAVIILGLLAGTGVALADGGMFFRRSTYNQSADIFQPTQKVYIRWDGSQERLLIQTKYEGPAEEMVWIVPVPTEPTVEKGDSKVFETLSVRTSTPDISVTLFSGLLLFPWTSGTLSAGGRSSGSSSPVEWRRQIGAYDVVLLRPVDDENVILWLNGNDFAMPDNAVPILQDYIRDGWWMVAAKIDPNALTDITRDKLAQGLLHPLEMTFESPTCLYPLRLTSMAAGPVEELIYIEGPTHYEPVTFADDGWQIDVFGGPMRLVPDAYRLPDIESTIEAVDGRTVTIPKRHLTKLRRIFQPEEMKQDIVFGKMDYAKLAAHGERLGIAQAATQYGRHRDPNGVPCLLSRLSPESLEQLRLQRIASRAPIDTYERLLQEVRSCIWALGEIAIEETGNAAEDMLVQCTQHEDERVRMDAYIALTKLGSQRLAPILRERFAHMLSDSSMPRTPYYPGYIYWDVPIAQAEMNIVADWILRFGTPQQKDVLIEGIKGLIPSTLGDLGQRLGPPERKTPVPNSGIEWLIHRAACTEDPRLIGALETARSRLNGTPAQAIDFLLRAEAACGSTGAQGAVVRHILDEQHPIVPLGQATPIDDVISLYYESGYGGQSLRVRILERRDIQYELYPMTPEISDASIRSAIATGDCCEWYVLYLLARIKKPQAQDKDRLLQMWATGNVPSALVAVDVLYVWGDWQTLVKLYGETQAAEVRSEIAWAVGELGVPQAAAVVEEQLRSSWNPEWIVFEWSFPRLADNQQIAGAPRALDAARVADAAWSYFHPEYAVQDNGLLTLSIMRPGVLDDDRLSLLKRLAADGDIHPGMRFDLIGSVYATTDWGKPLIEAAAAGVLQVYPDALAVKAITSQTSVEFTVDICRESLSDESLRSLLSSLLSSGNGYYLPVIEGLLWEVWPERYIEMQGQSILFREPGDLAAAIDYYCNHSPSRAYPRLIEGVLSAIGHDDSLPAGYRAFLLVYWPTAYNSFSRESVEVLLKEDMPDYIKDALQERLSDWPSH